MIGPPRWAFNPLLPYTLNPIRINMIWECVTSHGKFSWSEGPILVTRIQSGATNIALITLPVMYQRPLTRNTQRYVNGVIHTKAPKYS